MDSLQDLRDFQPPPHPGGAALNGRYVRLEPLEADAHAADLHRAFSGDDGLWDYMPYGPFTGAAAYHRWAKDREEGRDPVFFALRDLVTGHCGGVASFLRIDRGNGVIEVGHICLAREIQRSRAATEAMYLMMRWAFDAGYRRYEWKCNAENLPSRRAARRLGFSFEGLFRQHMIIKGRNRDSAWFSVIDGEWPVVGKALERWLAPENFTPEGRQLAKLSELTQGFGAADPRVG